MKLANLRWMSLYTFGCELKQQSDVGKSNNVKPRFLFSISSLINSCMYILCKCLLKYLICSINFFFKMSLKVTFQSTKVICFTAYILQTFLYIFSSIVYCHWLCFVHFSDFTYVNFIVVLIFLKYLSHIFLYIICSTINDSLYFTVCVIRN